MKALSNPFFGRMKTGARNCASLRGIALEVFGIERESDVEHQIAIVDNLIARGFRAIAIAPADSRKLFPVCKKALDKGVIVINIDNPFHKARLAEHGISIPFVGSETTSGTVRQGKLTVRIVQQPEETGRIAVKSAFEDRRGDRLPPLKPVELELLKQ